MTCPTCQSQVWATYICDDGRYRCWQCRAVGRGKVVVHKTTEEELREAGVVRPYVTRRKGK